MPSKYRPECVEFSLIRIPKDYDSCPLATFFKRLGRVRWNCNLFSISHFPIAAVLAEALWNRQGAIPARRLACKGEESDDGDGRVFTGADDDVTIRVWDANNVSATNRVWSQKIAGIEKPLEANVSKGFAVPPVGFEPTTHDLKGRCSNR